MKTENAISEIQSMERAVERDTFIHRLDPVTKLLVTVAFFGVVLSMGKYNLGGVIAMSVYVFAGIAAGMIPIRKIVKRCIFIMPVMLLFGLANIIWDRQTGIVIGKLCISRGWVSAMVLMVKGMLTVSACYILIATTGVEGICAGLRKIRVSSIIVTQIWLTYRYLLLLAERAGDIFNAYRLRSPGPRGINSKAWGPLLGHLLMSSIDRGQNVYESMILRGYRGSFPIDTGKSSMKSNLIWAVAWCGVFIAIRIITGR